MFGTRPAGRFASIAEEFPAFQFQISVVAGNTVQATATVVTETGTSQDTSGDWTSDDITIASVDGNGIVTGLNGGSTNITFGPLNAPAAGTYCYYQSDQVCPYYPWFGSGSVTVQKPGGFSIVSDTGNQGHQCYHADNSPAYVGVQRTVYYQLLDTNNQPIKVNGISMTEIFSTINDGCGLGGPPTPGNGPTFGGGQWGDGFVHCTSACDPNNPSYNPGCQSTFNHEWNANGFLVLNHTVTYACQSITP